MEKVRGSWCLAAVRGDSREMQVSATKTHRWRRLLLGCACGMVLSGAFPNWVFAAKCGEPGTCVILWRWIFDEAFATSVEYQFYDVSGYDYNCKNLQRTYVGAATTNYFYPATGGDRIHYPYYKWYLIFYSKYFWDGATWTVSETASFYTHGDFDHNTPVPPVPGEIVSRDYVDVKKLYPNGCSDLPSQQPDETPNFDTGKSECSNQIFMN